MNKIEVTIDGIAFPCRPTMGAMLRFKKETGKEITEIDPSSFTELCTYLWCCIVSASKKEGKDFNMDLMDFADSISPEDMQGWATSIMAAQQPEEKATTATTRQKKSK